MPLCLYCLVKNSNMSLKCFVFLFNIIIISSIAQQNNSDDLWWTQAGRSLGTKLRQCWSDDGQIDFEPNKKQIYVLSKCLQQYTKTLLKTVVRTDVIPLADGVDLVRYRNNDTHETSDYDVKRISRTDDISQHADDTSFTGWKSLVINTLTDIFNTHAIRITLSDMHPVSSDTEARRRRRRNHFMPLMIFGFVGLGMILVPMAFQFLAVLGGKALLLAKMALILTSIQGLKKVAHSNINYGLYHSAPARPWYDRKAEDIEYPYKLEDHYFNPHSDQVLDYKRFTRA